MGAAVFAKLSLLEDKNVWIATGMLAGTLLLGAFVLAMVGRWRKRQEIVAVSTHEQLANFRLLYEEGEISQNEYERLKKQLLGRLKAESKAASIAQPKPNPMSGGSPPPNVQTTDEQAS
jgi:hypothetical protein